MILQTLQLLPLFQILNAITEDVLDHNGNFRNPIDQCEFIQQQFEEEGENNLKTAILNLNRYSGQE